MAGSPAGCKYGLLKGEKGDRQGVYHEASPRALPTEAECSIQSDSLFLPSITPVPFAFPSTLPLTLGVPLNH